MNSSPASSLPAGRRARLLPAAGLLLSALPLLVASPASAQASGPCNTCGFAVLGASTVTNIGTSSITGAVGVAPGTAITGITSGMVAGTMHHGDALALRAQAELAAGYQVLAGKTCTTDLTGQDLGGLTLTPGVYCFAAAAQLTGALTLDAQGSSTAVFIFRTGSTLTTATAARVDLVNGAEASRVFWQVGSSATLGASTAFAGNLIALASITLGNGASVTGRVLARTAAVTMDTNVIAIPNSSPSMASWNNFGIGWPGSGGLTPTVELSALPVLGTAPDVEVQNVRGQATFGLVLWGTGPANISTLFGGALQVTHVHSWPVAIGTGVQLMSLAIPLDPQLNGVAYDLQVLQFDEGASNSVAFTRGLHIVFGQ